MLNDMGINCHLRKYNKSEFMHLNIGPYSLELTGTGLCPLKPLLQICEQVKAKRTIKLSIFPQKRYGHYVYHYEGLNSIK